MTILLPSGKVGIVHFPDELWDDDVIPNLWKRFDEKTRQRNAEGVPVKVSNWKGEESEGFPKFGKKARQWFLRSLRANLKEKCFLRAKDELESIVQWLAADPTAYVTWIDDEQYHGRRYSNGAWVIDWKAIAEGCDAALADSTATAERSRLRTLDDWLRADLDGSLKHIPAGGSVSLNQEVREQLAETARARRRTWPIGCVDCGETFLRRPGSRGKPIRCPPCLELRQKHSRKSGESPKRNDRAL